MFGRIRKWRRRSGLDKVDYYTRASVHILVWVSVPLVIALSVTRPVRHSDVPWVLICAVAVAAAAQGVWSTKLLGAGLDEYLDGDPAPRRWIAVGAGLMVLTFSGVLALAAITGPKEFPQLSVALAAAGMPFLTAYCLLAPLRFSFLVQSLATAAVCTGVWLIGGGVQLVVPTFFTVAYAGCALAYSVRCSAWVLRVMYELHNTRDVQARLAVAEERLRFGRDLHDVMGRNLAVIALKSELAVQLARRGRAEAVDQMVEVQRIARESQREVREVVRGYREVDLAVELSGAQGVLEAAGIDCRVVGSPAGLPAAVQSAFGWVVREAATNVLRHGDARHCAVTLRVGPERAVLDVSNDGVPDVVPSGAGSGLAGLRERLAVVDGVLDFASGGGKFRLSAEVPLAGSSEPEAEAVPTLPQALDSARAGETPLAVRNACPQQGRPEQTEAVR
ncbi:histidine kinase [Streptomyces sp. NBC_01381]|uniref:sensor histidine kinase n=1 Tax=Streptomyces sp. NBC_01381 TaxID=2903845 RepID=UPI00224E576F|nr:histidine kinase [Streptomyces sp. NBC_01381]MCX4665968.1 histidine kinase [Streptomyces sp. NBC_01381]